MYIYQPPFQGRWDQDVRYSERATNMLTTWFRTWPKHGDSQTVQLDCLLVQTSSLEVLLEVYMFSGPCQFIAGNEILPKFTFRMIVSGFLSLAKINDFRHR